MTDRATLLALAERCEHATGPDRELDGDILIAVHPGYASRPWRRDFTGSIDAAMTLVAMDKNVEIRRINGYHFATIFPPDADDYRSGRAATLPLALCAAALRVLAETAT